MISSGIITRVFNSKPIWAQLKITDRCNLQCKYCTEHSRKGENVKYDTVVQWLEHCAELGVKHVEFIGGEPLIHPDLVSFVLKASELKMNSGLTTNGFLLNKQYLEDLISSGVKRFQISIDCIEPNMVTRKALTLIKPQLKLIEALNIWAHVNSVITDETLPQARELAMQLFDMGIPVAFSPAHFRGQLMITETSDKIRSFLYWLIDKKKQGYPVNMPYFLINYYKKIINGKIVNWTCVGGCKAFYVNSDGRFCICSHKPGDMDFMNVNSQTLSSNHNRKKECENKCGVGCMVMNSFPFCRILNVIQNDILPWSKPAVSDNSDKYNGYESIATLPQVES